ncbi:MAG: SDR family oxidoreductase [Gammaproteobacteria bacterium]|nr:SDR family oxidoreductase [Gammaproteobacteria bacterium]MDH5694946.1 SDR family oxidoreductase [Gammaproteobacteria bacterium]
MINKRNILITGATGDIGFAIAKLLLQEGHTLTLLGRDFSKYEGLSGDYMTYAIDFSQLEKISHDLPVIAKNNQQVDALICCAGRGQFGGLEEFSYTQIRELMDLNFLSQAYVVRAFLPYLKRHSHSNLIILGSEAALNGGKQGSVYCASKFALRGFAQSLRQECARSGLAVSMVNPGMVDTAFFNELDFRPGDAPENSLSSTDIAEVIRLILAMRAGSVVEEVNLSPLKKVVKQLSKT